VVFILGRLMTTSALTRPRQSRLLKGVLDFDLHRCLKGCSHVKPFSASLRPLSARILSRHPCPGCPTP